MKRIILLIATLSFLASQHNDKNYSILFGLSQPIILNGFNVAGNYSTGKFIFDYSHGMWLDYNSNDFVRTDEEKEQNLDIYQPWTTGFGVGYKFTDYLNLRAEFKWNKYEITTERNEKFSYITRVIGIGLYSHVDVWKNIFLEPSIRYWPNFSSTLKDDKKRFLVIPGTASYEYAVHKAHDYGVFMNVSIGYTF